MSVESHDALEEVLGEVGPARRSFLKTLLAGRGAAVAVLALPVSTVLADDDADDDGEG